MAFVKYSILGWVLLSFLFIFPGCKDQQQMQNQITELENKITETQRRNTSMDSELRKMSLEISQLKDMLSKLGDVVMSMQKREQARQHKAADRIVAASMSDKKQGLKKKKKKAFDSKPKPKN